MSIDGASVRAKRRREAEEQKEEEEEERAFLRFRRHRCEHKEETSLLSSHMHIVVGVVTSVQGRVRNRARARASPSSAPERKTASPWVGGFRLRSDSALSDRIHPRIAGAARRVECSVRTAGGRSKRMHVARRIAGVLVGTHDREGGKREGRRATTHRGRVVA